MAITPLKMAAAGAAMLTLLMVFALQRAPAPASASASQARAGEHRFDAAWRDTVAVIPPLKKADRLQVTSTEPKVTERVPPAPDALVSVPPVILVQDEEPALRHRRAERNVCSRHGMRKVVTHGGRSWRCKRAR
jgi:hypothetical protein